MITLFLFLLFPLILSESTALTAETFEEFVKAHPRVLIEFYAPWCGHCKRLQPEYEAAARALDDNPASKTKLGKVDAVKHKEIAEQFGVRGYPTLKYFINGDMDSPVDYNGGRTKDKILSWVQTQELPAVSEVKTAQDLASLRTKKSIVLVAFLPEDDTTTITEIEKAAEKLRNDMLVGVAYGSSLLEAGTELPTIGFYMVDWDVQYFPGPITEASVMKIFRNERFPPIGEIGPDNYQSYMDRNLPLVWLALNPNDDISEIVLDLLDPYAIERKGKLSFVWLDADKFSGHIENLGIQKVPGFLIINEETNEKFRFSGDIMKEDELDDFFTKYDEGRLESFLKSEPVPEGNDGAVTVLVGSSFARYAYDKTKDVFVEFYAPWCGHCKKLSPEWDKLGDAFAKQDGVIIAKIDATENDTPEKVEGFPTLVLYPSGCDGISCGVQYKGARDSTELISWMSSKQTTSQTTPQTTSQATSDTTSIEADDKDEL